MSASMMILLNNLLGYVAEDASALTDTSRISRIQPDRRKSKSKSLPPGQRFTQRIG
jgi:hypothetical protein